MKTKSLINGKPASEYPKDKISNNLIAQDFHFYTDGKYRTVSKYNSNLGIMDNDLQKTDGAAIRIFGTKTQINKTLDEYCDTTGLNLDESFNYKREPKGSYWQYILNITEEQNKAVDNRLKEYTALYKAEGQKPLTFNLV